MYTDNANSSEEEFVVEDEEHDSDEYQDSSDRVLVERSVPSRYHPEDPLKGITSQSHVPSGTSLPSYMAGRTPSNTAVIPGYKPTRSPSSTSEEGTILRREVTDLKNKKKFLEFQIQELEIELRDKKVHVEEKESALELRERNLLEREQTMVMERGNIDIKLKKLAHKERELEAMEDNLIVRKKTLEEREFLLSDMPQESSHNSREKERELNEWEDRLKKKEKHLTEWTKELHEEAEKIRLKKLKMDQEFEDKLAALNLMEQETSELTTIPISETAVSDPHASEDLELAKSIQEKLWQDPGCEDEAIALKLQELEMKEQKSADQESERLAIMLSQQLDTYQQVCTYVSLGLCGISNYQFRYSPYILSRYYYDHGIPSAETVDNIK
jgi:hypothetical protein